MGNVMFLNKIFAHQNTDRLNPRFNKLVLSITNRG